MSKKTLSPLLLIAGPCVLEGEAQAVGIAKELQALAADLGVSLVFKASYDKANRTSAKSYRGPGATAGLAILGRIKKKLGVPILTDVHEAGQVAAAAKVADILQIPAFLCRQTDLLVAAARSGRTVNVKKGQFLSPGEVNPIAAKLQAAKVKAYYITERGTTFGYNNLVVDMRGLAQMRAAGHRVIFDATHSVQAPGGLGTSSGGDRRMASVLARAAVAVGVDGLFIETHPRPERAPSDGANMIPLADMEGLLRKVLSIRQATNE